MASGRELCYVLLSGILCCYAMSFVILAKPTVETCAIMRVGLGLCLSICYSAIFTKTNRISRIFNRGVKSIKRPVYTSPISQVAIALGEHVMTFKRIDPCERHHPPPPPQRKNNDIRPLLASAVGETFNFYQRVAFFYCKVRNSFPR